MDHSGWEPPDNPEPRAILREAVRDRQEGRFEIALAKHLWFHEHALEHQESLYGVRLSFAIGYWMDLAKDYPPAMQALIETRDEAENRFLNSRYDPHVFHDFVSLNKRLNNREKTVETFKSVAETDQKVAQRIYQSAENCLIEAEEYRLCGDYLQPEFTLKTALSAFQIGRKHEESWSKREPHPPKFATRHLIEDVGNLIALLVHNDRNEEAKDIAEQLEKQLPELPIAELLEPALAGRFP